MSYIIPSDLKFLIQKDNLDQVSGFSVQNIIKAIRLAESEAKSYLVQKYDLTQEFTDTTIYNPTLTYSARNRVYLSAPVYDPVNGVYAVGSMSTYQTPGLPNSEVYICTTAVSAGTAWNPASWSLLGWTNQIWYALYPHPPFDPNAIYTPGDVIWYKNNIYTCIIGTQSLSHDARIQINQASLPEFFNILPDDTISGVKFWGQPTLYTVPAGSLLTDTIWVDDDNRGQQILTYVIYITLFHIHARISPQNIPSVWIERYRGAEHDIKLGPDGAIYPSYSALGWLQSCAAQGGTTPDLPLLMSQEIFKGRRIRWGSDQKQDNNF